MESSSSSANVHGAGGAKVDYAASPLMSVADGPSAIAKQAISPAEKKPNYAYKKAHTGRTATKEEVLLAMERQQIREERRAAALVFTSQDELDEDGKNKIVLVDYGSIGSRPNKRDRELLDGSIFGLSSSADEDDGSIVLTSDNDDDDSIVLAGDNDDDDSIVLAGDNDDNDDNDDVPPPLLLPKTAAAVVAVVPTSVTSSSSAPKTPPRSKAGPISASSFNSTKPIPSGELTRPSANSPSCKAVPMARSSPAASST